MSSKLKEMINVCRKFPEKLRRRSSAYFEPERRESVKSIRWIRNEDWKIKRVVLFPARRVLEEAVATR